MVSLITFLAGDREFAIEFGRVAQITDAVNADTRDTAPKGSHGEPANIGDPVFVDLCAKLGIPSSRIPGSSGITLVVEGLRQTISFKADRIVELLFLSEQELRAAEITPEAMMHRVPVSRITFPTGRQLLFLDPDALVGSPASSGEIRSTIVHRERSG